MKEEDINIRLKENKSWYNKSYSGFFTGIYEQAVAIAQEAFTNPYMTEYIVVFQNFNEKNHFDTFWDYENMSAKRASIIERVKSDPNFLDEMYKEWLPLYTSFVEECDRVAFLDLGNLTNDSLKENFLRLHCSLVDTCRWSYTVDILLSNEADEDWLVKAIKDELGERADSETIEVLTQPSKASFVEESHLAILEIAKLLSEEKSSEAERAADIFCRNYFWVRTNYKSYSRFTKQQVLDEARDSITADIDLEIKRLKSKKEIDNRKKKDLFESLSISNDLRQIIALSEQFTFFQDKRKEKVLRMNTLFYEFLDELARRYKIPSPLQFYLTAEEAFTIFEENKYDEVKLRERYENGFAIVFFNNKCTFVYPKEYAEIFTIDNFFPDAKEIDSFKGSIAYKGKVRGIARVLKTVEDIKAFRQGEILIANQTTPEYVPAMKKAAAIVTDQGGITCHAAIVSRELRLPAIIGTKIATKVLKDGDMVEVDAERGIVRILK